MQESPRNNGPGRHGAIRPVVERALEEVERDRKAGSGGGGRGPNEGGGGGGGGGDDGDDEDAEPDPDDLRALYRSLPPSIRDVLIHGVHVTETVRAAFESLAAELAELGVDLEGGPATIDASGALRFADEVFTPAIDPSDTEGLIDALELWMLDRECGVAAVARKLRVSVGTVRRWIARRGGPSASSAEKLARLLAV